MTHRGGDGLVFDAEVRRGGFTLAVSLTAACGEVLGLLGPNGAGKSTLLSAVAGLTPVSAGRITLADQVLDDADAGAFVEASGRPVGFVFQNYRLFPHLTVAENVAFSPRARGQGRRAARTVADHWLDRLLVLEGGRVVQEGTPAQIARQPATDYVAKLVGLNLYVGQADGSQVKLTGGGAFIIADRGQHGDVLVAVRPSAVVVSSQRPQPSSARNTWPAKVTGLTLLADRVRLDLEGEPPALVDVTPAAVAELSLRSGSEVWLTTKATDLEVYPRANSQAG